MDVLKILTGLIGAVVTLGIFIVSVIYKIGHHAARLESLEAWRVNVRSDMHEISDKLETISSTMRELKTLVEERTERRTVTREKHY